MTSYASLPDNARTHEDGFTSNSNSTTPLSPPSEQELASAIGAKQLRTPLTPDSFSESEREKMDSTPENIKKIDDVINEGDHHRSQHQRQNMPSAVCFSPQSEQYTPSFVPIGLAAAVDDSNAKLCLAKPPPCISSKEMVTSKSGTERSSEDCGGSRVDNQNDEDEEKYSTNSSRHHHTSSRTVTAGNEAHVPPHDQEDNVESVSSSNGGNTTMTTSAKQSLAFTIDNFNDKECDAAAQAAKYKSMMERFQNRHRRGASMSKLENDESGKAETPTRLTSSQSSTPLTTNRPSARNSMASSEEYNATSMDSETSVTQKVKMRARDRSTSRVRDASKRHSWSPRSSTNEDSPQTPQLKSSAVTTTTPSALPRKTTKATSKPAPAQVPKGTSNMVANRTQFTPRSTAMQLALKQVDFMCPQPPLADFKHLNADADADDVSEAGTYTLDGDNYTEEQKDIMNIDKYGQIITESARRIKSRSKQLSDVTPTPKQRSSMESKRSNNVLEVNYYHGSEEPQQLARPRTSTAASDLIMGSHQSAGAYLEKIKLRVLRNMNATKQIDSKQEMLKSKLPNEDDDNEADTGCFTSVTTSGVLAKQRTLDVRPKLSRHSGLSTSQIDSSEYVSNETKLKTSGTPPSFASGFTDHQKAEYRLNVFTNQKEASQKFAATRNFIETPPETPTGLQPASKLSEVAVLQTAQTKHDWIQEWARNARARSLASDRHSTSSRQANNDMLMTRSYTCADTGNDSMTDDSLYSANCKQFNSKLNRTLAERYRLSGGNGDCDYTSDPSLSSSCTKPPKSPTKIPSPLHTLGRTRSASRTRSSLQNVMAPEEEDYLQQTAAAINNLQQNLSRKNSIKSPSHSASPRAHSARSHIMYSPEGTGVDCSPQHGLNSQRQQRQAAQNLMTSSINEQQLQLLTSGEYLLRQMRMRKNSFDGNLGVNGSPHRRVLQAGVPPQVQSPTTPTAASNEESLSPLRRSSSFSARVAATQRSGRPNFQNLYTPPAARHSYGLNLAPPPQSSMQSAGHPIKKSASSNNFGQAYSDYDENLQYYINDEDDQDDLVEEYYSSGGDDNGEPGYYENAETENSVPLSNTRYNKALLMRIERSKQKVSAKPQSAPPTKAAMLIAGGGVMACPNTPELPRRNVKSATTRSSVTSQRQSMPRDTSLSRLAQQVPNSLASAKKQLLQTAANVPSTAAATQRSTSSQRATPRYLDISKYKPAQSNQFLRKNDAKSTLKPQNNSNEIMKRSPSSSSMGLSRTDPSRTSNRSVRSASSAMTSSATSLGGGTGRASSAVRRDASVSKQKEAEMAMWKRRSKYDPMKAAAEDRRKKEEAKRLAQTQQLGVVGAMPTERLTILKTRLRGKR
ncbi:uncharacterized protein LOC106089216 isoform X2 [Stomoxys calcitrans]|uniref:uncharacterized protein LOC106089216 isoform X2 n=1 Tax=Stomoxys calcitrans TaxID=35570 RepID=UPI0027E2B7C5|nr:uncharacterized protein LOC106089216 isoform X2 [Stomoxys calcitrans]